MDKFEDEVKDEVKDDFKNDVNNKSIQKNDSQIDSLDFSFSGAIKKSEKDVLTNMSKAPKIIIKRNILKDNVTAEKQDVNEKAKGNDVKKVNKNRTKDNQTKDNQIKDGETKSENLQEKVNESEVSKNGLEQETDKLQTKTKKSKNVQDGMQSKSADLNNQNQSSGGDDGDKLIIKSIDEVLHESMIPYTEHVVMDRALPRVEDGLKPVQRRILYTMLELDLVPSKQYRKSARIVGDCMGKYHPHGDSSVYDAMVRMAQDYSLREPLVDGHGNFGSVDGDSAAAMRYTEAKMAPLTLELLRDLEKDTVDWGLNFDDTEKEPITLPGRFPNLLVNGATGIAVGVATNIPPHNLVEVIDSVIAYVNNPKISVSGLMKYIKAPDFPTGAIIYAGEGLKQAYQTGKGKITIRAKVHLETEGNKTNIVITEMPYQVNKASLLQKIAELKEENKTGPLSYIGEILDESDRNGMRAVIRVKKDGNPNQILEMLYKMTSLQMGFNINMVAIAGGKPRQLNLAEIISYYVDYQIQVLKRRSHFELNNALAREHILEGLLKAIDQIDKIIKIIRTSKTVGQAKERIVQEIGLTQIQAQAILDMRLARLVNLEIIKLQEENAELKAKISELKAILASKELQDGLLVKELSEIKKKYGSKRRSEVFGELETVAVEESVGTNLLTSTPCIVAISADKKIKNIPIKNYSVDAQTLNEISNEYDVQTEALLMNNSDSVFVFTDKGNCLKLKVSEIPESKWKRKGTSLQDISKFVAFNEVPVQILPMQVNEKAIIITSTKQGFIKKTEVKEYLINRQFIANIMLRENDQVVSVQYQSESKIDEIIMISKQGYSLKMTTSQFPLQRRTTSGIKAIKLGDDDEVIFAGQVEKAGGITLVASTGFVKKVPISDYELMARYRRGMKTMPLKEGKDFLLYARYDSEPNNIVAKKSESKFDFISTKKISYDSRTSKGKQLIKTKFVEIFTCQDRQRF